MAYDLLPVHMSDFMMRNGVAVNHGLYHKVVNTYSAMTYTLHKQDCKGCPSVYSTSVLSSLVNRGKHSLKIAHSLLQLVGQQQMFQSFQLIVILWRPTRSLAKLSWHPGLSLAWLV